MAQLGVEECGVDVGSRESGVGRKSDIRRWLCMQCTPNPAILTVGNENNVDHSDKNMIPQVQNGMRGACRQP